MIVRSLNLILLLLSCSLCYAQDTANIYFSIGNYQLTAAQKKSIDSLMYNDVLAPGRRVGIIGYADIIGDEKSNKELSVKRANAVATYLQHMDIDTQYIEQVTGVGEVNRAENTSGYPQDRRVAIIPGGFTKKVAPAKIVDLTKVATNTTVALDNILFQGGCAIFLPQSIPTLEALYIVMRDNPKLKIAIEGHVCCTFFYRDSPKYKNNPTEMPERLVMMDVGSENIARSVSNARAKAVYDYLVQKGISAIRLTHKGFGVSNPLKVDGVTDVMNIKNRRVEIRVLAK